MNEIRGPQILILRFSGVYLDRILSPALTGLEMIWPIKGPVVLLRRHKREGKLNDRLVNALSRNKEPCKFSISPNCPWNG